METGLWFMVAGAMLGDFFLRSWKGPLVGSVAGLIAYAVLSYYFSMYLAGIMS